MFVSHPALEADHVDVTRSPFAWPVYQLAQGVNPEDLHFGALGYAHEAKASYMDFLAARQAAELAKGIKFQVCLPTPYAVVIAFGRGRDFLAIETAYTQAMLRELATLCASIPHQDLVIQWDVCFEMLAWVGSRKELLRQTCRTWRVNLWHE